MFTHAIVRTPCANMTKGLTTAGLGQPDHQKALAQHAAYTAALRQCGLEVTVLPPDEGFPDSTFVEDTALLLPGVAVIMRPGAPSRLGEIEAMEPVLRQSFGRIERIAAPGTVDGGDIMNADGHHYIGLSQRTNRAGADQLIAILRRHGLDGTAVPLQRVLHLKTGVACLDRNNLVVSGEFVDLEVFRRYNQTIVDADEAAAANCILINGTVIMAAGYPKMAGRLEQLGYTTIRLDLSEFQKLDGGASCLSLRY